MPKGFIITKWTDEGLEIPLSYPKELSLDYDDLMRIFYAHITGAADAGVLLVRLESAKVNVNSFFSGMESENSDEEPYMINLVLDLHEEPDSFGEAALSDINSKILGFLKHKEPGRIFDDPYPELKKYLKNAMFILQRLESMGKAQRIAQIFSSKKGRCILEFLQEKPRSKAELKSLVEKKLNINISNFEVLLDPFLKTDLIKQDWIEGFSEIYLFLKTDFVIYRKPPEIVVASAKKNNPTSFVAKQYLETIKADFKKYQPTIEDSIKLAEIMINPDIFDFILLFREKPYMKKKIPKSPRNAFVTNDELIETMIINNIVEVFKDKDKDQTEWVFLMADIEVKTFFPAYMIENIRKEYNAEQLQNKIAVKSLTILEKAHKK